MGFLAVVPMIPAETFLLPINPTFCPVAAAVVVVVELAVNPALVTLACKLGLTGAPNKFPLGVKLEPADSLPSVTLARAVYVRTGLTGP